MQRDGLLGLFACIVLSISYTWQIWARRSPTEPAEPQEKVRRHLALAGLVPSLLCALALSIGVLLLLPWAAAVTSIRSGWVPGGIFMGFLFVGAVHILTRRRMDT